METRALTDRIVCSGALFYAKSTRRFLLLQKSNGKHIGTWGLVGGTNLQNENPWQGLQREIQEEIGLIEFDKIIPLEKFTADNQNFEYHTYLVTVQNEFVPVLNNEHRGYAWTAIEDHPKPLHPGVWRTFSFKSIIDKIKIAETVIHQPQEQIV